MHAQGIAFSSFIHASWIKTYWVYISTDRTLRTPHLRAAYEHLQIMIIVLDIIICVVSDNSQKSNWKATCHKNNNGATCHSALLIDIGIKSQCSPEFSVAFS